MKKLTDEQKEGAMAERERILGWLLSEATCYPPWASEQKFMKKLKEALLRGDHWKYGATGSQREGQSGGDK